MEWRNGGGSTREVFAWPPASDLETFDWRVSVATIERDGPFSQFANVTRTAVLMDGAGVRLRSGARMVELLQPWAHATFDGAAQWQCELLEGLVHLFNVMARRPVTAQVQVALHADVEAPAARHCVVYAAHDTSSLRLGGERCDLAEGDACIVTSGPAMPLSVSARGCALITRIAAPAAS